MILLLYGKFTKIIEIGLILGSPRSLLRIGYAANAHGLIKRIEIKNSVDVIIEVNLNIGETLLEIIIQLSE